MIQIVTILPNIIFNLKNAESKRQTRRDLYLYDMIAEVQSQKSICFWVGIVTGIIFYLNVYTLYQIW